MPPLRHGFWQARCFGVCLSLAVCGANAEIDAKFADAQVAAEIDAPARALQFFGDNFVSDECKNMPADKNVSQCCLRIDQEVMDACLSYQQFGFTQRSCGAWVAEVQQQCA